MTIPNCPLCGKIMFIRYSQDESDQFYSCIDFPTCLGCSHIYSLIPPNEHRILSNGILVQRYRILGTNLVIYDAYEPSTAFGPHSTITFIDNQCYGRLYTRVDDGIFDHLSIASEERCAAVQAHYDANAQRSYAAILEAFPEVANVVGRKDMGSIEVWY